MIKYVVYLCYLKQQIIIYRRLLKNMKQPPILNSTGQWARSDDEKAKCFAKPFTSSNLINDEAEIQNYLDYNSNLCRRYGDTVFSL